jgi:hypothetical protein
MEQNLLENRRSLSVCWKSLLHSSAVSALLSCDGMMMMMMMMMK